jgi:hypothetical protein
MEIAYNKTISSLDLEEEKISIYFKNETEHVELISYGDCCSHSWFEYPDNINNLFGKKIVIIEDGVTENISNSDTFAIKYDDDQVLKYEIIFKCDDESEYKIHMYNSSNGYYSGYYEIELH